MLWSAKAEVGLLSVEQGLQYESEQYLLTAADGYEVEINKADLAQGLVYVRDGGEVAVKFDGLPKNTSVKGLLAIEAK